MIDIDDCDVNRSLIDAAAIVPAARRDCDLTPAASRASSVRAPGIRAPGAAHGRVRERLARLRLAANRLRERAPIESTPPRV